MKTSNNISISKMISFIEDFLIVNTTDSINSFQIQKQYSKLRKSFKD